MAFIPERQVPVALWRTMVRLDHNKINTWMALRNALGVAVPLAVATALHAPLSGVAIATGALNVSFSDGHDPYPQRGRRMLTWSVLGAVAVFTGSVTGGSNFVATGVVAAWAMLAGMLLAVGSRAGDLGLNTLVTVIVFAAHPMPVKRAVGAGLLVLAGGLLQTAFALLLWPIRRRQPEREAVGQAFLHLAKAINSDEEPEAAALLDTPAPAVQDTLNALGRDHSVEGERYRLLFDQANRIAVSAFMLRHASGNGSRPEAAQEEAESARLLQLASQVLEAIGRRMSEGEASPMIAAWLDEITRIAKAANSGEEQDSVGAAREALAGQLRVVAQLAERTTPEGLLEFSYVETSKPWKLQLTSWVETLRVNAHLNSVYFRHAVRLAVCVAIGDALGRGVDWMRTYWIPMTIAVILKPDFGTTFSRGGLRLLGTFMGLVLATVLYHVMPATPWTQLLLVGAFALILRSIGPANYGVFSAAVAGLVVFLIAATGISPAETVDARAVNTAAGGVLALVAYAVWPTWERTQVRQTMADMIDRCREYFHAVAQRFEREDTKTDAALEEARRAWRLARSTAEASVDRLSGEPGARPEQIALLTSMLASSHSVVYSVMVLETELRHVPGGAAVGVSEAFIHDVEFTLYYLAAALRGAVSALQGLPDLRKSYRALADAQDELSPAYRFLVDEMDRLTVSLNTLREQVQKLVQFV